MHRYWACSCDVFQSVNYNIILLWIHIHAWCSPSSMQKHYILHLGPSEALWLSMHIKCIYWPIGLFYRVYLWIKPEYANQLYLQKPSTDGGHVLDFKTLLWWRGTDDDGLRNTLDERDEPVSAVPDSLSLENLFPIQGKHSPPKPDTALCTWAGGPVGGMGLWAGTRITPRVPCRPPLLSPYGPEAASPPGGPMPDREMDNAA